MNRFIPRAILAFIIATAASFGQVTIDVEALGRSLGGWNKRGNSAAEYELSGATYRTYRPEVSPTPDGGLFVSLRIDHMRGWLASNDHAVLEITVSNEGAITSAKSSIAIQGRAITSDLIRGTTDVSQQLTNADKSVKIGTDLVADLSAKLLRERIVEAGRVTFPAALRHNYNILFQSIRTPQPVAEEKPAEGDEATAADAESRPAPRPASNLNIKPYGTPKEAELPVHQPEEAPKTQ
jgi:hypothetical protein